MVKFYFLPESFQQPLQLLTQPVQHNEDNILNSTVQYSTVQYSTVQYSTVPLKAL